MAAPPGVGRGRSGGDVESELLYQLIGFPADDFIDILAPLLERLMERNEALPLNELTSFHARSRPPISVASYLKRFLQYAPMSNECYILMLIYLDRISQTNPVFCITPMNAHRMIVTGLVLAAKFSQDRYYTNTHYARVGGLPPQELKALELEFLARIFYTLWADPEVIEAYWAQLLEHAQRNNLLTERAKAFLQSQQSGALARPPPYISHSQLGARPGAGAGEPPDPNSVSLHLKKPRLEPSLAAQRTDQQLNDEAMRYELLRRQQERLRTHMQGLQQYAPAPPEAAAGVSDQSVPLVSSLQAPNIAVDQDQSDLVYPAPADYQQQSISPPISDQAPGYHGDGVLPKHSLTSVFRHPHRQSGKSPMYTPYRTQTRSSPLMLPAWTGSGPLPAGDEMPGAPLTRVATLSPRSASPAGGIRSRSGSLESFENPPNSAGGPSPSSAHISPCGGANSANQSPAVLTPV